MSVGFYSCLPHLRTNLKQNHTEPNQREADENVKNFCPICQYERSIINPKGYFPLFPFLKLAYFSSSSSKIGIMLRVMELCAMFPGLRFDPTDRELICYFLKRKIDGLDRGDVIAEVDICDFEPWELPAKSVIPSDRNVWFFFYPNVKKYPHGSQSKRATQLGYWKATGQERSIKFRTKVIGTKRTLVFHKGRARKADRTNWIIHEYCLEGKEDSSFCICRLRMILNFTSEAPSSSHVPANYVGSSHAASQEGEEMLQSQIGKIGNSKDDCFSDILNDDIIMLDEALLVSEYPELKIRQTQEAVPSSTFMSPVHPSQGTANRRIRLQTYVAEVEDEEVQGVEGEGNVTKVMERDGGKKVTDSDDQCNKLIKSWKSRRNPFCTALTVLIIVLVFLLVSLLVMLGGSLHTKW